MPRLGRHLSLVRLFTAAVKSLLVDDVQHYLRVHITASGTGAGLSIGIAGGLLEIGNGVDGVAVEYGVAATVKQPQAVKELVDVARWLVDVDNDELALKRLLLKQVDHLLGVGRRQSRRGFVEE